MTRAAVAALAGAAAFGAAATGAGGPSVDTAHVACSARSFVMTFDPKRRVVVTDGAHVLATATFTSRFLSRRCRRVAPTRFVDGGLGSEILRPIAFRCASGKPIRIHVHPIRDDRGAKIGSSLSVSSGPLRVIAAAVLKNKGDPYASTVYRARAYCKHGA